MHVEGARCKSSGMQSGLAGDPQEGHTGEGRNSSKLVLDSALSNTSTDINLLVSLHRFGK